jgi:hypothetical protein
LPAEEEGRIAENDFYRVEVDENGRVLSLVDKELGRELSGDGPWHLNQFLYEEVTSTGGRADLLSENYPPFDFAPNRAKLSLSSPEGARICVTRDRLGVSLISVTSMPHFPSIVQEIRLDNGYKRVDFTTRFVKEEVEGTEAVYIAFPFAIRPDAVRCDISGGVFTPGREQIPGTSTDWYNLQHGVQLIADGLALTWLCGEGPLVEFGEMKTGKTPSPPILDNGLLFSYALNNHWFTNFFARQGGEFTFHYRLLSARATDVEELERAGRNMLTPFTVVRIGAQSARDPGVVGVTREQQKPLRPESRSGTENVASFGEVLEGSAALEALKPARDGDGFILRLYEIGGQESHVRLRLSWPTGVRATLCDLLERPQEDLPMEGNELRVLLKPFGTATLRLRPVAASD